MTPVAAQSAGAPDRPARPTVDSFDHESVTISWDDPGDASITGHQILRRNRSTDPIGPWIVIHDNTGDAATSYTDDTAEASVRYRYRVKARNAHGLSRRSPFAVVETPDAPSEPVVENRDENDVSIPPIPDDTPMTLAPGTLESGTLESATLESDDFADSTATTGTISVGGSASGDIETKGDRDWFAVSLVAGTDYQIDLKGQPTRSGTLRDPYLRGVHDPDGDLIDRTDDDDGTYYDDYNNRNSRLMFRPMSSGVHYLAAGAYGNHLGTYTLFVAERPADDFVADRTTTGVAVVDGSVTGNIEVVGDTDWFALQMDGRGRYRIDLKGASTGDGTLWNPWLSGLYHRIGTLIYDSDDDNGGTGRNSRVEYGAGGNNGVIYIEVGSVDSTGTYTLSVTLIPNQTTCHGEHCS